MRDPEEIAHEAIARVEKRDLPGVTAILLSGAEELAASADTSLKRIADDFAFCALKLQKATTRPRAHRQTRTILEKIQSQIVDTVKRRDEAVGFVLGHLSELESLSYIGALNRNRSLLRRPKNDCMYAIRAAFAQHEKGEELTEEEWSGLAQSMRQQLDYFEFWRPAPIRGLISLLATGGYVREGMYPRYVRLMQKRKTVEAEVERIVKSVRELSRLLDRSERLDAVLFHQDRGFRELISEINQIAVGNGIR